MVFSSLENLCALVHSPYENNHRKKERKETKFTFFQAILAEAKAFKRPYLPNLKSGFFPFPQ
jgi:hypothetical protein